MKNAPKGPPLLNGLSVAFPPVTSSESDHEYHPVDSQRPQMVLTHGHFQQHNRYIAPEDVPHYPRVSPTQELASDDLTVIIYSSNGHGQYMDASSATAQQHFHDYTSLVHSRSHSGEHVIQTETVINSTYQYTNPAVHPKQDPAYAPQYTDTQYSSGPTLLSPDMSYTSPRPTDSYAGPPGPYIRDASYEDIVHQAFRRS
ncbi:hypothetical protein C8R45DRAFT_1034852 [Mycena sanguinolenta]|nr:hypothetical protein C8R45DRAFT_1034852 [Mycena sanguinolenta]